MQLLIIQLVGFLGWLSSIASAQIELSELTQTVVGSLSFPVTCIANLVACYYMDGRKHRLMEMAIGARDVLATMIGPKLKDIPDNNLQHL